MSDDADLVTALGCACAGSGVRYSCDDGARELGSGGSAAALLRACGCALSMGVAAESTVSGMRSRWRSLQAVGRSCCTGTATDRDD
jgi:hypothetical protein